ncbi:MAG: LPS export ABC transporter ATP-binding protein [Chthoniobacterales bacterium]
MKPVPENSEKIKSDSQNPPQQKLAAHNLSKHYRKHPVLYDISLHVSRGEAIALLGPNGAGKTTCFYIMTGLIAPDSGRIILEGKDVTQLPMHRRAAMGVGYLPQETSIFRGLNVEENIYSVLQACGIPKEEREEKLESLLDDFSIQAIRQAPSEVLSGGERRRVEIARALAADPQFILLDEPLAGIDPIAVRDIRTLITQLKCRGIGVLITDHNVRDTLRVVDRAYILSEGHILHEGTPDEIIAHSGVRNVYLGDDFEA